LFLFKSAINSQLFASFTIVQTGTFNTKSGAFAQAQVFVHHFIQGSAFKTFLCLYSDSVFKLVVVKRYTSHQFHQLPPRGHHLGIYFSLLQETNQSHHLPEITFIFTSSINILFYYWNY
jgi:hypothetical protein